MAQWMKMLVGGMCVFTILLHLAPDGQYVKYIRFYAGLLFFLMIMEPVLAFFGREENLEQLLQLQLLKEEYEEMEYAAEGLSDLRSGQILEAYQTELKRQITQIAEAYSMQVVSVEIEFGSDGYSIENVFLTVDFPGEEGNTVSGEEADADVDQAEREIADLYQLSVSSIEILERK